MVLRSVFTQACCSRPLQGLSHPRCQLMWPGSDSPYVLQGMQRQEMLKRLFEECIQSAACNRPSFRDIADRLAELHRTWKLDDEALRLVQWQTHSSATAPAAVAVPHAAAAGSVHQLKSCQDSLKLCYQDSLNIDDGGAGQLTAANNGCSTAVNGEQLVQQPAPLGGPQQPAVAAVVTCLPPPPYAAPPAAATPLPGPSASAGAAALSPIGMTVGLMAPPQLNPAPPAAGVGTAVGAAAVSEASTSALTSMAAHQTWDLPVLDAHSCPHLYNSSDEASISGPGQYSRFFPAGVQQGSTRAAADVACGPPVASPAGDGAYDACGGSFVKDVGAASLAGACSPSAGLSVGVSSSQSWHSCPSANSSVVANRPQAPAGGLLGLSASVNQSCRSEASSGSGSTDTGVGLTASQQQLLQQHHSLQPAQ